MEQIWEALQPIVTVIAKDLITFIAAGALIAYGLLKTKVLSYIKNELLHKTAVEGFALVETQFSDLKGTAKYNQAFIYTSTKLGKMKIKVTSEEIQAAIEKACLEYNANKIKGKAS